MSARGAWLLFAWVAIAACGPDPDPIPPYPTCTDAGVVECNIVAPTECPTPAPTYAEVEPIFAARCRTCHDGIQGGQWALTTYGHVSAWRDTIRSEMLACSMPPRDSCQTMLEEERMTILNWIRCDLPQ